MANLAKSVLKADGEEIGYFWHGEVGQVEVPPASLYITDPPYNIGINYGGGVNVRLDDAE